MTSKLRSLVVPLASLAALAIAPAAHAQKVAVWLSGDTTDGGNSIPARIASLGYTPVLVTAADLDQTDYLSSNGFSAIVVSRYDSSFGAYLSPLEAANVSAFVGSGASEGGVALFTNDAADDFLGSGSGDPYDASVDQLFLNSVKYAVQSGHGYIGEFNGAAQAMDSNDFGVAPLGLLQGSADDPHGIDQTFVYTDGPVGSGNAIDAGVTFPFTDLESSDFLTDVSGFNPNNEVLEYSSNGSLNGEPALLANDYVINGGQPPMNAVPEPSTYGIVAVAAMAGIVLLRKNRVSAAAS